MFKFSLVSDLHVNHPQPSIDKADLEEYIIVAGDTANGLEGLKMLEKWKRRGHKVFAVDGNHEHYSNDSTGRTISGTERRFYEMLSQTTQLELSPGLAILGCNGWYHVEDEAAWLGCMNDGRYAGNAYQVNEQAALHANHLNHSLDAFDGKVIVVTHTAPCEATLDQRYTGTVSQTYYWNPWMDEIMQRHAAKIAIWVHGHTHAATDQIVHGVRVVTNPRGYPGEVKGWRPKTIEVI